MGFIALQKRMVLMFYGVESLEGFKLTSEESGILEYFFGKLMIKIPTEIESSPYINVIGMGSSKINTEKNVPNTGTRLINTPVRVGPIFLIA